MRTRQRLDPILLALGGSGAILFQALAFLLLPRAFPQAEIGTYSVALAFVYILSSIATLKLDSALLATPSPRKRLRILKAAFSVLLVGTLCAFLFCAIAGAFAPPFAFWIIAGWTSTVALSLTMLGSAHFIANNQVRKAAILRTVAPGLALGCQLAASYLSPTAFFALVSEAVGRLIALGILCAPSLPAILLLTRTASLRRSLLHLRLYRDFTVSGTFGSLLTAIALFAFIPIVAAQLGPAIAASFSWAQRITTVPIVLLNQSLYPLLARDLAKCDRGQSFPLFKSTMIRAFVTTVLCVSPIIAFGPSLFSYLLGNEWKNAGEIARLLALSTSLTGPASVGSAVLIAYRKQRFWLPFNMFEALAKPLTTLAATLGHSTFAVASTVSIVNGTLALMSLSTFARLARKGASS